MNTVAGELDLDAVDREEWSIQDAAARSYVRSATGAVASLVRTTLGPDGLEKLVETHDSHGEPEVVLSADAEGILAAVERGEGFNHPVAALFVDAVDTMQRSLGDGTGTAVLLADELVAGGLDLVEKGVHPNNVVVGYSMAAARAGETLDTLARECDPTDVETLTSVARTSMTTDMDTDVLDQYATLVAKAVTTLAVDVDADDRWLDTDDVRVLAASGAEDTLRHGVVLRRRPGQAQQAEDTHDEFDWTLDVPNSLTDATVAVLDATPTFGEPASSLDAGTVSAAQYQRGVEERARHRDAFANRVVDLGTDVLVCQEALDDDLADALRASGVSVVDRAQYPKSDVYRLARATGATAVTHPDDLTSGALGVAGRVHEVRRNDEKWTVFEECSGPVLSLTVGAETASGLAERERLVEDAVEVTSVAAIDRQLLPGAGAPAAAVATDLRGYATSVEGQEQLAVEAFADALEALPMALARNAGLDPVDAVADLRHAHAGDGYDAVGLDLDDGTPVDAWNAGVVEPRRVFSQAVETARAAAEQLLTVDAVLFPGVEGPVTPRTEHE